MVDPYPARRHRRFIESVLKRLSDMEQGTGEGALLDAADHFGPMTLSSLAQRANLSQDEASAQYAELEAEGRLIALGANPPGPNTLVYSAHAWAMLQEKVRQTLSDHHRQHPLQARDAQGRAEEPPGPSRRSIPGGYGPARQRGLFDSRGAVRKPSWPSSDSDSGTGKANGANICAPWSPIPSPLPQTRP